MPPVFMRRPKEKSHSSPNLLAAKGMPFGISLSLKEKERMARKTLSDKVAPLCVIGRGIVMAHRGSHFKERRHSIPQ